MSLSMVGTEEVEVSASQRTDVPQYPLGADRASCHLSPD